LAAVFAFIQAYPISTTRFACLAIAAVLYLVKYNKRRQRLNPAADTYIPQDTLNYHHNGSPGLKTRMPKKSQHPLL
jgi:hypothetical protein